MIEMTGRHGRKYAVDYIHLPHGRGESEKGRDLAQHTAHKNMPTVTCILHLTLPLKLCTPPPITTSDCEPTNGLIPYYIGDF